MRHIIKFPDRNSLINTIQDLINPEVINAIHCSLPVPVLIELFPSTTFKYSKSFVKDITDKTEQKELIVTEHNRAHRAAQENVKQILRDYFFPKMLRLASKDTLNCKICSMAKYSRHPTTNGQVERFHSTLAEKARCLKIKKQMNALQRLSY